MSQLTNVLLFLCISACVSALIIYVCFLYKKPLWLAFLLHH